MQSSNHHDEIRLIDTGHGKVELSIYEENQPPHWRLYHVNGHKWHADEVQLKTQRDNSSSSQLFDFIDRGEYLESKLSIPEPHAFQVCLSLGHKGHAHEYEVSFDEHEHSHDHDHSLLEGLDVSSKEYQDAHELAHANDIKRRFNGKEVTNWQILLFGLTGGLIPCPAAITVLLICLQLKAVTLGATLVVCFSLGLALTLVTVGVGAAISIRHVAKRWSGFSEMARKAPYFSSALIAIVGLYMGIHGLSGLV